MELEYELLLKSHGPERAKELLSQRYSIYGDQKPILVLHSAKDAAQRAKSHRTAHRSVRRKSAATRNLSHFLAEADPTFEAYSALTQLWHSYIADVLGPVEKRDPVACTTALLTADWHGAPITVMASKCPSFVGISGVILWEARSEIILVTTSNRIRQIPKRGCLFKFTSIDPAVVVVGARVLCRSSERTTRKFKPRNVDDIAPLIRLN